MEYEYSMVPFPATDKEIGGTTKISTHLEALANQRSAQGWEFYRVDQIGVLVPPGCLASLFRKSTEYAYSFVVTFRRQK